MQPLGKHADPDGALWKDLDPEYLTGTGYKNVKIKFMNVSNNPFLYNK